MNTAPPHIRRKQNAARYQRLKTAGICVFCGRAKAIPGQTMCGKCATWTNKLTTATARRRRAKGKCWHCSQPAVKGGQCREHYKESQSRLWLKRHPEVSRPK